MNRKQIALVKRANAEYRKQRNAERRLEKVNQDPRQQHNWDEWVRRSGYVQGLSLGLDFLNEFIRLGSEPAPKPRKKRVAPRTLEECSVCGSRNAPDFIRDQDGKAMFYCSNCYKGVRYRIKQIEARLAK